jgi:hypothetical protein
MPKAASQSQKTLLKSSSWLMSSSLKGTGFSPSKHPRKIIAASAAEGSLLDLIQRFLKECNNPFASPPGPSYT